eukprot:NODE_89_length_21781_cov_0.895836.p2 type:complete len:369 gc:universal NODE_89_length_21781_cov_0.895836:10987-12093(+)
MTFPLELQLKCIPLSKCFLINKELTEIYLRHKYKTASADSLKLFPKSSIFNYNEYLQILKYVSINDNIDYALYPNLKQIDAVGYSQKSFHRMASNCPLIEILMIEKQCAFNFSLFIHLKHLKSLEIAFIDNQMKVFNQLPNLTELTIHRNECNASFQDLIKNYAEIPPLKYITTLIIHKINQISIHALANIFVNCKKLIANQIVFETNEISYSNFTNLQELSSPCPFIIPEHIQSVICDMRNPSELSHMSKILPSEIKCNKIRYIHEIGSFPHHIPLIYQEMKNSKQQIMIESANRYIVCNFDLKSTKSELLKKYPTILRQSGSLYVYCTSDPTQQFVSRMMITMMKRIANGETQFQEGFESRTEILQ